MTVAEVALSSDQTPATDDVVSQAAALSLNDESKPEQQAVPPHRSHDPTNNQKRSDPFQFGSRYLSQDDDPFEFNAWDHVETDDAYKEYAEAQFEKQRQAPASDFDKSESSPSIPATKHQTHRCYDDPTTCIVHLTKKVDDHIFLLSLPSECISYLHAFVSPSTRELTAFANVAVCFKADSTVSPQSGGTSSTRTTLQTSSRTASGSSRSSRSLRT